MDSLNHHKYKWNSSHSDWTRYMPIILSTINLGQMQTAVTRNSRHSLLSKTTWSNIHLKINSKLEGAASSYVNGIYIVSFSIYEMIMFFKGHHADKKGWCTKQNVMDDRHMLFVIKDTHIKYLFEIILRPNKISKRMLPIHATVMDFFDTVDEKNHQRAMDNLYSSDDFFKAVYNHEKNYWLMVLRGKEWGKYRHTLHKRNWIQRRHRLPLQ